MPLSRRKSKIHRQRCDIVLPVHNGLTLLKNGIQSVIDCTLDVDYHLYLVDDASDAVTRVYLQTQAEQHERITLHVNPENLGFVKSCNLGIAQGNAPFVALVNSDVIVTPGWLQRLLECANSDPRIASVNPLTNYAAEIKLPMAPGANFYDMQAYLEQHSPRHFPDVVTGVGFCLLLRRSAIDRVGAFDEIYGHGYCEESDLCMRLTTNGYRTVVADHVYVYHKGRGTFTNRDERYRHNRRLFDSRWGQEYPRQYRAFLQAAPLQPARELFAFPLHWDPMPAVWETAREMLACWRERKPVELVRTAGRGLLRLIRARREKPLSELVERYTRPGRLRVTYVLNQLVVAGGVLSVVQLINELTLLGVEARIAALYEDPALPDWLPLLARPLIYGNAQELIENFPESDIAVATLHNTVPWVNEIARRGRTHTTAYFIQDYEPWFFPESEPEQRARVLQGYQSIEYRIVKSDWLRGMLQKDGLEAQKIRLGMDLATFYPRGTRSPRPTVLAMARPSTPRRGFAATIEALHRVKNAIPETEIILFGDRFLSSQKIPFAYRDAGVVIRQDQLAALYSEADVFLDGSDFQGFGRCALEAMACGAACVLTGVGGVTEYARDEENCLVVPPKQPERFTMAIIRLIEDAGLRERLVQEGFDTVRDYCHKREAVETLAYFQSIVPINLV